ncbi:hypothetical protein QBC39DRAFT_419122 [Podospora conica]|nr:hypothetical protein QBC39DRAFT_419122 [Schizothecium conicum]
MPGMREDETEANRRLQRQRLREQVQLDRVRANQVSTLHPGRPNVPRCLPDAPSTGTDSSGALVPSRQSHGELVPSRQAGALHVGHLTTSTRPPQPSVRQPTQQPSQQRTQQPTFIITNVTTNTSTNTNAPVMNLDNSSTTITKHSNTQANHTSSTTSSHTSSSISGSAPTESVTADAPGRFVLLGLLARINMVILGLAQRILAMVFRNTIGGPLRFVLTLVLRFVLSVLMIIVPLYLLVGYLGYLFRYQLSLVLRLVWYYIGPHATIQAGTVLAAQTMTVTVTPTWSTSSLRRVITNPAQLSLFAQQNQQVFEELTRGPPACSSVLVSVIQEVRTSPTQAGAGQEAGGEDAAADVAPNELVRGLVGQVNITALTEGDLELFQHMSQAIIRQSDAVRLLTGRITAHPISINGYPGTIKRFFLLVTTFQWMSSSMERCSNVFGVCNCHRPPQPMYEPFATSRARLCEGIAHLGQVGQWRSESKEILKRVQSAGKSTAAHVGVQRRVASKYATRLEENRVEIMARLKGLAKKLGRGAAGTTVSPDTGESVDDLLAQMAAARGDAMVAASLGAVVASLLDSARQSADTIGTQMETEYGLLFTSSKSLGHAVGEIDALMTRNIHIDEIKFVLHKFEEVLLAVLNSSESLTMQYFELRRLPPVRKMYATVSSSALIVAMCTAPRLLHHNCSRQNGCNWIKALIFLNQWTCGKSWGQVSLLIFDDEDCRPDLPHQSFTRGGSFTDPDGKASRNSCTPWTGSFSFVSY